MLEDLDARRRRRPGRAHGRASPGGRAPSRSAAAARRGRWGSGRRAHRVPVEEVASGPPPRAATRPGTARWRHRGRRCARTPRPARARRWSPRSRRGSRIPSRWSSSNSLGPAAAAVVLAMREARLAEAAVATGCRPADTPGLEQDDPRRRVLALREQRGPQAGVAAADDGQVAAHVAAEPRVVVAGRVLRPEHRVSAGREGVPHDRVVRSLSLENGAGPGGAHAAILPDTATLVRREMHGGAIHSVRSSEGVRSELRGCGERANKYRWPRSRKGGGREQRSGSRDHRRACRPVGALEGLRFVRAQRAAGSERRDPGARAGARGAARLASEFVGARPVAGAVGHDRHRPPPRSRDCSVRSRTT